MDLVSFFKIYWQQFLACSCAFAVLRLQNTSCCFLPAILWVSISPRFSSWVWPKFAGSLRGRIWHSGRSKRAARAGVVLRLCSRSAEKTTNCEDFLIDIWAREESCEGAWPWDWNFLALKIRGLLVTILVSPEKDENVDFFFEDTKLNLLEKSW